VVDLERIHAKGSPSLPVAWYRQCNSSRPKLPSLPICGSIMLGYCILCCIVLICWRLKIGLQGNTVCRCCLLNIRVWRALSRHGTWSTAKSDRDARCLHDTTKLNHIKNKAGNKTWPSKCDIAMCMERCASGYRATYSMLYLSRIQLFHQHGNTPGPDP